MRTIKFRGKTYDSKWVYGDLIHGVGNKHGRMYILPVTPIYPKGCDSLDGWDVIPETVGQLICVIPNTSMYVDNSRELYEDDIFISENRSAKYVAKYDDFGEYYGISNKGDKYGAFTTRLNRGNIDRLKVNIIGNIHDDPKLLTNYEK
ncbi:hypothetical protein M2132_002337 [Dysgonomonas sp. PH5-45]|uniref:YopX family protein n=1 Tax=unclassified Dysgonomonas TaxID=2630389 RepID=UPI0024752032|nr:MULTISPECIES: YopX family protein [unclassified Dysgonomonas]MDH6355986.1 hypothetical protein [Dysgonomonas sp. PH5-45]MDH6388869.1 hypothetical protein [Dysgonomonas sp. PH5-37]